MPVNNCNCGAYICDDIQTNIVTEDLSIVHCRVSFCLGYCIMLTKGRAGLLKLDRERLSVKAILLCTFIVYSDVK